tara:strand:+ start:844 stop:1404 length:561 start_codon:yes stop_codon:yes gene_type:complete
MNFTKELEDWRERSLRLFNEVYAPHFKGNTHKTCLLKASAVMLSANRHQGFSPHFQAGSASWRFKPEEKEGMTHLQYLYEPEKKDLYQRMDMMPEVHCWVYDETLDSILDLSLMDQERQLKGMFPNEVWEEEYRLPSFLARGRDGANTCMSYEAHGDAMAIVMDILKRFHYEFDLNSKEIIREYSA